MYYGNSGAAAQQNKTAVWDANYKAVWHLDESGTTKATGEYKDSTSTGDNGTLLQGLRVAFNIWIASSAVIGARWNVTSFITSTKIPPRPNMSMGPNCGSRVIPMITSRPRGAIFST